MKKFVGTIFLLILFFSCKKEEQIAYDLVIENGNVIDIVTGNISKQTIFINDERIVNLSKPEENISYKSEIIIDATDKYILPGFWDNHVHFRGGDSLIQANKDFLKLFIMNGITTVRDAGGDLTSSVMEWKQQIQDKQLVGPTIFSAGPKIDGNNATWAGSLVVDTEKDISVALDSLQALNVDFVKLYDSRISGELYLKTIQEATKRGMITSGHMPFTVTLDETLDSGIGAIEHLYYVLKGCSSEEVQITEAIKNREYGFWSSMGKLIETYQDSTAKNTFDALKNNNTYVVPTLHIGNVLSYLDEVNHENDAYLKLMPPGIIETYQGRIKGALNSSEEARQNRKELNTFFKSLAKSLSDANVKLLTGSDSGAFNSYTYPGISLHKELEGMVSTGISNLETLQNSAYNGAHFLKKESDYGTIEIGKISDLVLLNSNPLEDIKNTRNINFVIKGNEVYNPEIIAQEIGCSDCLK
ncbi:amidohydrolase family protein [Pontimicrobium aquaticum]|uniref:Amidohydrolase n=1 Tax=Pontimicrobium aquaticum TaxID=2565367 RepID=A0A4U0EYM3_9FLAO|nr:amidohydrolase family protein [Pontimicrobium aquaticum]TJY37137.1 amidohydrolase [Pontimicrobium aquaticum]